MQFLQFLTGKCKNCNSVPGLSGSFLLVAIPTWLRNGWRIPLASLVQVFGRDVGHFGLAMAASLVACHVIFH